MNLKQKMIQDILNKISIMEQNTFLMPIGFSDKTEMTNHEWSYRSYTSDKKGDNRYCTIEIYLDSELICKIIFHGNNIKIDQYFNEKQKGLKEVNYYISEIFEELHSFKNHNEGIKKLRKDLSQKKIDLLNAKNDVEFLQKRIKDFNVIK